MSPCRYRTPVIKFLITNFIFAIYDIVNQLKPLFRSIFYHIIGYTVEETEDIRK